MADVQSGGRAFPAVELYRGLKMVIFDVDGVLTDGRLIFDSNGVETKCFHVKDGAGMALLRIAEIQLALVSGRRSAVTEIRARDLRIPDAFVKQHATHKLPVYEELIRACGLSDAQVAYMGDDIIDLPVLERAGLACCPCDAQPEVQRVAHAVSTRPGGQGAVRQLCEHILKHRDDGTWERVMAQYMRKEA